MPDEAPGARPIDVLFVDGEQGACAEAARALQGFTAEPDETGEAVKFLVRCAATGREALEAIRASAPEILFLDSKLPDMSAVEVLDAALKGRFIKIIMSACPSMELAVETARRGATDFLRKPCTPEDLDTVMRKAARSVCQQRTARRLEDERHQARLVLISVLAHELKSPLAAVEGYMHLIKARMKGPELAAYDGMLDRSVIRIAGMRKLIMDTLDLTRLESGRKRAVEPVDLAKAAASAAEGVARAAAQNSIAVQVQAGPVTVNADPREMDMVLNNLLTNAVKYNKKGGSVKLEISEPAPGRALIRCADTGIGLTPEEQGRLFGEFVRMKNEHTRSIDGTGLGLSILRKVVELYGGEVKVTSGYGEGSVFEVTINSAPAVQPQRGK